MNPIVRRMTRSEADLAVDWAAQEGWNPGLSDAECFYRSCPEGFFICVDGGKPLGCISAVAYGEQFGFIGFFIVRPEFRGGRVGVRLGQAALDFLGQRNIGLDGVENKLSNYEAFGFKLAYNNIRYEGCAAPGAVAAQVVALRDVPFADVLAYDQALFPASRAEFLALWLAQPRGHAVGVLKDGRLAGYGVSRPCRKGSKIGPLFADDPRTADTIFQALSAQLEPGWPLYLDIPQVNGAAVALAEGRGMRPVFKTARMYSRGLPDMPTDRIYGVTSFELG
jgi:GNAT superfamily N-acetyltransferase